MRNVTQIHNAPHAHWVGDGFRVQPLFSHMRGNINTDPFLMLDYAAPQHYEPNTGSPRGVGQHPHKGFETVTVAYQGEVAHRDSSGGGGVIKTGDVQWMTAGDGVIHEEFHSEAFSKSGGDFEMVQLWVNLPAKDKSTQASYQHLANDDIPVIDLTDNDGNRVGHARLIAGEYLTGADMNDAIKGLATTFTPINMWDIVLDADTSTTVHIPATHNLMMVVLRGDVSFNGDDSEHAHDGQLVCFEQKDGAVTISAHKDEAKVLLLSGVPINEPVVGYGPFVMNTEQEIRQAINDFNSGKFGRIA